MRDAIEIISFMAIALLAVLLTIFGLGYAYTTWQCGAYERVTGKQTKVEALSCYIQQDGQWMHWSEYKLRFATKGAQ